MTGSLWNCFQVGWTGFVYGKAGGQLHTFHVNLPAMGTGVKSLRKVMINCLSVSCCLRQGGIHSSPLPLTSLEQVTFLLGEALLVCNAETQ